MPTVTPALAAALGVSMEALEVWASKYVDHSPLSSGWSRWGWRYDGVEEAMGRECMVLARLPATQEDLPRLRFTLEGKLHIALYAPGTLSQTTKDLPGADTKERVEDAVDWAARNAPAGKDWELPTPWLLEESKGHGQVWERLGTRLFINGSTAELIVDGHAYKLGKTDGKSHNEIEMWAERMLRMMK